MLHLIWNHSASCIKFDPRPLTHNLDSLSIQNRAHLLLVGKTGATVINCTTQRSSNLRITRLARVTIRNIIFVGCNMEFSQSNNTEIEGSRFLNGTNGALEFSHSFNVSIDKSLFDNNGDTSRYGGVIKFSYSRGIEVSRSNFTNNNTTSSYSGSINMDGNFHRVHILQLFPKQHSWFIWRNCKNRPQKHKLALCHQFKFYRKQIGSPWRSYFS